MNDKVSGRFLRPGLLLCLCCAVSACGGGGGSQEASVAVPASLPVPAPNLTLLTATVPIPVAASTPTTPVLPTPITTSPGIDASCGLNGADGIRGEVLQRVNAFRAAGAICGTTIYASASPLNWNKLLQQVASDHSSDMAQQNFFSHDSLNGTTLAQRLITVGYNYTAAGENIAANDQSVEVVLNHWLNSPGHCRNMMNPIYSDIGVACVHSNTATFSSYWTMDLGRP